MTIMRVGLEVLTVPFGVDEGGLALATDGDVTYLRGTTTGQTLVWNEATGAWEVSSDLADVKELLEEMVFYLATMRELPPTTKLRELCDALEAKGIV